MAKSENAQLNIEIGKRIKRYRKAMGWSQTELGKRINVTFQQIQKYENATNRIAAERLIDIASALHVPVQMLVPTEPRTAATTTAPTDAYDSELKSQLLAAFQRIKDPELKKSVVTLAECLCE